MAIDKCKQSSRWKRNKAQERARNSPYPKTLAHRFIKRVLNERDRRAAVRNAHVVIRPRHGFFEPGTYERAIRFAADVWAADTWLREEWGPDGAMPRRVAAWLTEHGEPHGYSDSSLPKMISKARVRVNELERPQLLNWDRAIWAPFDPDKEAE